MKKPGSANEWRSSIQGGLCGARIDQEERRESMAQPYKHILLDYVLPFWFPSCVDEESGGFFFLPRSRRQGLPSGQVGMGASPYELDVAVPLSGSQ